MVSENNMRKRILADLMGKAPRKKAKEEIDTEADEEVLPEEEDAIAPTMGPSMAELEMGMGTELEEEPIVEPVPTTGTGYKGKIKRPKMV